MERTTPQKPPQRPTGAQTGDGSDAAYSRAPFAADLPMCPSLNHLFPTVNGRRVRSPEYNAWCMAAGLAANWPCYSEDRKNRIPWAVAIEARGLPHSRDLDNIAKPVIDLIAAMTGLRDGYCNTVELARAPLLSTEDTPYLHIRIGIG